ncbi:hypothetical protein CGLO_13916 [Colletotrichum gloeosporioides Cg-14]|uniref:Uncharacterized protein n=1 Tax=Colletotrichum gloeosporioides (strain Cg-14) TaxID=1237896 RepID=T0K2Q1_COLGC|nr:hypothetical protein CGLO_13916 [Colletotrichum gloeosporioides Cg-14]
MEARKASCSGGGQPDWCYGTGT